MLNRPMDNWTDILAAALLLALLVMSLTFTGFLMIGIWSLL